ncbi:acetamidase/formamidase family protein [Candidatus Poribacteria bacterium]|nr:acetamidase/formamidase family protein [Candidatus Poribacteria bacterium]
MRYIVSDEHRVYEMSPSNPPALEVPPGSEVTFITRDCFDGQVDWSRFPESLDEIDRSKTNPATGPVAIEGARPGDTLCVEILDVKVGDRGFANRVAFPISDGEAILPGGLRMPIKPVIGVIGVAPAEGSFRNSMPGDHGGNLDTKEVTVGSKVYLPVQVEGALLAMGDIHALQGDGEVCGQGIEIGGRITVRVNLVHPDLPRKPMVETPSHICIITAAETLDRAADDVISLSRRWLAQRLGISEREAFALLSTVCDLEISQIVNPLKAVKMCIPKDLL